LHSIAIFMRIDTMRAQLCQSYETMDPALSISSPSILGMRREGVEGVEPIADPCDTCCR